MRAKSKSMGETTRRCKVSVRPMAKDQIREVTRTSERSRTHVQQDERVVGGPYDLKLAPLPPRGALLRLSRAVCARIAVGRRRWLLLGVSLTLLDGRPPDGQRWSWRAPNAPAPSSSSSLCCVVSSPSSEPRHSAVLQSWKAMTKY